MTNPLWTAATEGNTDRARSALGVQIDDRFQGWASHFWIVETHYLGICYSLAVSAISTCPLVDGSQECIVCTEYWWTPAQERYKHELILFSWSGYPRCPSMVVGPQIRSFSSPGPGLDLLEAVLRFDVDPTRFPALPLILRGNGGRAISAVAVSAFFSLAVSAFSTLLL